MSDFITNIKRLTPDKVLEWLRPPYHFLLAYLADLWFRHPSRSLTVIGVTGTKGKSSVSEIMSRILTANGHKVATLSTIHFRIGEETEPNLYKMTMPGRFFVQKFLHDAVKAGCTHAVIEITSEGARQFRHRFLELDALIFTNLTPGHIEYHGSFDKYKAAKLSIAERVQKSKKPTRCLVANIDDEHGPDFLKFKVENLLPNSLKDLSLYSLHRDSVSLVFGDTTIRVPLVGLFNVYNILACITLARAYGITLNTIDRALRDIPPIAGRVEQFVSAKNAKRQVTAVVDYAHTPDSLEKLYQAFPESYKICVLGNTGGGRDTWKRPEMGAIAGRYCDEIILTNEDPYDENPRVIVEQMAKGIEDKAKLKIIMDRKEAIATAIKNAPSGAYVLVSGKGTDPFIMGPNGSKLPWSDAKLVKAELEKIESETTETFTQ